MPRLPTHSLITRAVRAEPTRVRHRKGATTAPSPLFLSQPSYPLSLSPTWLPPKCPSLFNQAIPLASIVSPFFSFSTPISLIPRHIGPLTQNVKRSLNITNPNADPVSFKIKTTAPKVRHFNYSEHCPLSSPLAVLRQAQLRKG